MQGVPGDAAIRSSSVWAMVWKRAALRLLTLSNSALMPLAKALSYGMYRSLFSVLPYRRRRSSATERLPGSWRSFLQQATPNRGPRH